MHLAELLGLRHVPGAGVLLELTRRCPLSCRHCCTSSLPTSPQHPGEPFIRLVRSFTRDDHPRVMMLSGGEALVRPRLVRLLALLARAAGTRTYLLSGAFFAGRSGISPAIMSAIAAVDHLALSLDVFHEEQVPRAAVLDLLERLVASDKAVSVQVTGADDDDRYLAEVTAEIGRRFGDRVPVLAGRVSAAGRAAEWTSAAGPAEAPPPWPVPCTLAAWPVVTADGTVAACCSPRVVDGPVPAHLRLGHAATDGWPAIHARLAQAAELRALRAYGPWRLAAEPGCDGYCATCRRLGETAGLAERANALMGTGEGRALEVAVAGLDAASATRGFVRRYGVARYADLALLGSAP